MNISLTPELERFVRQRLASGMYTSASEIVREGLRLLAEQEKFKVARLRELRGKIEEGWASAERGELIAGERVFTGIKKGLEGKGRQRRKG